MDFDLLPGMENFIEDNDSGEEEDFVAVGKLKRDYFDAAALPDAPEYQHNAENSQTYILHLAFPSFEEMKRAINALTGGQRTSLASYAKVATINAVGISKQFGISWLDFWEMKILGMKKKIKKIDVDEAQAPEE